MLPSYHSFSISFAALIIVSGFHVWFLYGCATRFFVPMIALLFLYYHWWTIVGRERCGGDHTLLVEDGLKVGIIIFIIREVFFFSSFFWSFFHYTFSPALESGGVWPPIFFSTISPNNIPLVNTGILLRSGAVITWAHSDLLGNKGRTLPLVFTFLLGFYFLAIQGAEYYISPLTIRDGAYGAVFFVATGFHGFHVFVGATFLLIILLRFNKGGFSSWTHLRYEISIWYWHFVDVVWLFLFSFVYYWGN